MSIDDILPLVSRPSRYAGNEFNIVKKEWRHAELRCALVFPDLYEIGMSHQGLQILYHLLNNHPRVLAERAYAPAPDMEKVLRDSGRSLFGLESHRPLGEFDFLGITLPYELCYTNILTILDLAGMPFRSLERDDRHPLVIGGGPGAFHPEPVAEFFDAILLGDGEEAVLVIAELLLAAKSEGAGRAEVLRRLAAVEGVYVPSFFEPRYDHSGNFSGMRGLAGQNSVRRRILADIENSGGDPPLVPLSRIVHDRLGIEIARGCTRGCRFCQAGMVYRPVRERSPARILELAEKGINESGFDELALLSLSTGDYSCISELLVGLMDRLARDRVAVSMPSMRVGTLTAEIMDQIKRVRKSGFTLAPEAGTDRLRRVINKGITEEDLLTTSRAAFDLGWKLLKFYFMFGLPTETDEDLAAIPLLAKRALQTAAQGGRRINISVATFVPKPHTPFQRARQLGIDEGFARIDYLKKEVRGKNFQLKWHDPRQSYLEGVMSRGDRRLSTLIEAAWRRGARLDAWTEHYRLDTWLAAAESVGIDLDGYLRRRDDNEPLPWNHLDCRVDPEFIEAEQRKALTGIYTPDCRVHGCQKCGLCDFKIIKPVVVKDCNLAAAPPAAEKDGAAPRDGTSGDNRFIYRIDYSRLGPARFSGHLEVIQLFYRVLRRVRLPLNFSQGFNPSPRVTFSPALPLGTESRAEYLLVELHRIPPELERLKEILNRELPAGFAVRSVTLDSGRVEQRLLTCYHIKTVEPIKPGMLDSFAGNEPLEIEVTRKGRRRRVDARLMLHGFAMLDGGQVEMQLLTEGGKAALKPMEIMAALFDLTVEQAARSRVMKMWSREA
ncbi:MAG: TIGR03960 family B12-binding radical SAM protein [Desulfobulbales bacterium]|nr:TIGR03960 family B12-binding radical SAM protein [Desulfobulbales bacterium]